MYYMSTDLDAASSSRVAFEAQTNRQTDKQTNRQTRMPYAGSYTAGVGNYTFLIK